MSHPNGHPDACLPAPKIEGNPEGKGDHAFLTDWCATQPLGVVAKTQHRVLAELFTSLLVLLVVPSVLAIQGDLGRLLRRARSVPAAIAEHRAAE